VFTFFKKKKRGQGMNALVLSEDGLAHACVSQTPGQPPTLNSFHYSAIKNKAETVSTLQKFVQEHGLQAMPVVTTLLTRESNLVMLDKPEVADDELRQAVRWRIKDSLPFDVNQAIIDVFEIPGQKERGRPPLVYITAAEKEFIRQRVQLLEEQGVELESIDIAELVMRNIAALLPENQNGVALLKLDATQGLITLVQDSSLYLARNLDVGYASLTRQKVSGLEDGMALEEGTSPDQQRTLDAIVLEVQRSLDYYESHFAKPAINSLVIAPLPYEVPGVINYLASALGLQVRLLDLNAVLDLPQPISEQMQARCFFAIGAALRVSAESLQTGKQTGKAA
jgi:MSHA biogenesis protein MshI